MSILEIKKFPDKVLRKKCAPVPCVGEAEKKLLQDMAETMYLNEGLGLAASQVGCLKRLIVVDGGGGLLKLANPSIVKKEGHQIIEEGCLSVPETRIKIKRPQRILVKALDENNKEVCIEAEELLARAVQHEIDHLDGKLIIDYIAPWRRMRMARRLRRAKQKSK